MVHLEEHGKHSMSVGPWGGLYGSRWDDGEFSAVKQLVIAHGSGIDSIQIEYDKNGTSVWSEKHGGTGGPKTDKVKLDHPNEYLTSIHGHYGSLQERGSVFVRSLTFVSNKRTYGPYGIEQGTFFSFPMTGGKIVGFHGKSGWYLDAIGAYLEPLQKQTPANSLVPSQNYVVANGTEKFGCQIIQGSIGQDFDVILALRQKKNATSNHQSSSVSSNLSRQSSSSSSSSISSSDSESKVKKVTISKSLENLSPKTVKGVVTYPAFGGSGGSLFDDGFYSGIKQIHVSRNVGIVSVRVMYEHDGKDIWGAKNGGTGAFKTDKITLDYPYEVLTHITGFYGPTMKMGPTILQSLTFHTTSTKYGPYGEEQGQQFTTKLKEGRIVGIHGRKGLFLDAIGVHAIEGTFVPPVRPVTKTLNRSEMNIVPVDNALWSNKPVVSDKGVTDQWGPKVVKEPARGGPGPWGGDGGRPWDDGVFSGIKQILLTRNEAIYSIQIEYDRNGQSVWSAKHGGDGAATKIPIKLEYPHEVLTCISGFYGPICGDKEAVKVVKSLTFHTSRRVLGPYGEEVGTFFTSVMTEGKVVGLHGRSGMYLDAIGVHMQHWLGGQKQPKTSLRKRFSQYT